MGVGITVLRQIQLQSWSSVQIREDSSPVTEWAATTEPISVPLGPKERTRQVWLGGIRVPER